MLLRRIMNFCISEDVAPTEHDAVLGEDTLVGEEERLPVVDELGQGS